MKKLWSYASTNLRPALRTSIRKVLASTWLLAVPYCVFALCLGLSSGLLVVDTPTLFEVAVLPPLLLVYPCLIEESVFRGLLLPRSLLDASRRRRFALVSLSTGLFVLMHPLNALLIGLSDTSQFLEPAFLAIVAALGYTCGYLYLRSGSLWAPIAVHWASVVSWNLFLGRDLGL